MVGAFDGIDDGATLLAYGHNVGGATVGVRLEGDRVTHLKDLALAGQPHDAELVGGTAFHLYQACRETQVLRGRSEREGQAKQV